MKIKSVSMSMFFVILSTLTGCDRFENTKELLARIDTLETALKSSHQQIQDYQQKEKEYLQKIADLQTANQQLENKHRRNLDALFQ